MIFVFWKRECQGYFNSPVGYVFIAGMLCVIGVNTYITCVSGRIPVFEEALGSSALLFLFMVPILTMRAFSEDRKNGMLPLFYSMPLHFFHLVLGKFLALLSLLAFPLLLSTVYPLILSQFGTLSFRIIISTYFGFFTMGAALMAIGLLFSALFENQAVASTTTFMVLLASYSLPFLVTNIPSDARTTLVVLVGVILLFSLYWMIKTKNSVAALSAALVCCLPLCLLYRTAPKMLNGLLNNLINGLSIYSRFYAFSEGILDVTALVYYITLVALTLFFTIQVLEYGRVR